MDKKIDKICLSTYYILPLLNRHPVNYPKFRNSFVVEHCLKIIDGLLFILPVKEVNLNQTLNLDKIYVLTRAGGNNRDFYKKEIEELRKDEFYIKDYDEEVDPSYATFVFNIPPQFKQDVNNIANGENFREVSQKYKDKIKSILCTGENKEFDQQIKNCFGIK